MNTAKFREWCRRMRKLAPLDSPVRIRRVHGFLARTGAVGLAQHQDGKSWITIDAGLDMNATWETLAHEWAHLLLMEQDKAHCDDGEPEHPDEFFRLYGTICRAWDGETACVGGRGE